MVLNLKEWIALAKSINNLLGIVNTGTVIEDKFFFFPSLWRPTPVKRAARRAIDKLEPALQP